MAFRKNLVPAPARARSAQDQPQWLDLAALARVEITSETVDSPIEAALQKDGTGWRAAQPGEQTIRILFDAPQHVALIRLKFTEQASPRTQEFVLRWSAGAGQPSREIVRQQYHFSPPAEEVESYTVDLCEVMEIELVITPDIAGWNSHASLAEMRLGTHNRR